MIEEQVGIPKRSDEREQFTSGVRAGWSMGLPVRSMNKRIWFLFGGAALLAATGVVVAMRGGLWTGGAVAQSSRQNAPQAIPVEVVSAVKKTVPVRIEVLGSVT